MRRIRFVSAASLFDGHDVSINIMRRLLQSKGVEVIHLGHNRSALDVVNAAISEDVHGIALSSYQGGHTEYFLYIRELLDKNGGKNIKIFGGGGGVITPKEIDHLQKNGISRIYSPEDGMEMGLDGIIDDMIAKSSVAQIDIEDFSVLGNKQQLSISEISKVISQIENDGKIPLDRKSKQTKVLGITGTGGAGKSSLIDELLLRFHRYYPDKKLALISVDPTKKKTQGALLGDRIRLGSTQYENIYVRSLATRDSNTELSPQIKKTIQFLKTTDFDLILVESSGIGQASDAITGVADLCLYVMTPEYGASSQLEKIEMLEQADFIAINKFERPRSEDALRDVRKQFRRDRKLFLGHPGVPEDDELPIFGTMASKFNDHGVNALFKEIVAQVGMKQKVIENLVGDRNPKVKYSIISPERSLYLREIASIVRNYNSRGLSNVEKLKKYEALKIVAEMLVGTNDELVQKMDMIKQEIGPDVFDDLALFNKNCTSLKSGKFDYKVRDKIFSVETKYTSLAQSLISKVAFPKFNSISDTYKFINSQNLPGFFPFGPGIFPFKRKDEDPKRMFAGEGGPGRTNKRFHYLSENDDAKRLSTAFDSATLYGEDPDLRPDIFGKIGEAGVSIATLDDMFDLFKGFDLKNPATSVSMTINGPAAIILAMYMNVAIKQNYSGDDYWDEHKRLEIMRMCRGTVQADILKEDQAQNTCIFSLEFALKLMGDVQEYFCKKTIKNYYTVSISGYHIAEAGANPITQLALTLSNGFTFVEYYLGRGMKIDEFSSGLSFFFSNGLDPEYTVLGRVARKIWAVTLRDKYGASTKSQKFKYHIQTSGRSLHAQEIDFNDIRTTLQAFLAISDSCNSLHTNAYDEAITTPTEESVRRAMAIQMIINKEFGLNKTDNPLQGAFIYDELADLVEEAVLKEFDIISDKGGVLGAMESMYQRGMIQEESLYYERLKDSGEFPIIGVNTFIADNIEEQLNTEIELSRTSDQEKHDQINRLNAFKEKNKEKSAQALLDLKKIALAEENIFAELLKTVNFCTLGEITSALYEVGGQYRRNM